MSVDEQLREVLSPDRMVDSGEEMATKRGLIGQFLKGVRRVGDELGCSEAEFRREVQEFRPGSCWVDLDMPASGP